ncbi:MAG TPA: PAS domain S-box protein, partial [Gammaproteobacteria bacterium]|nr:PAS domain S-box protein [Gammaproteobacteria bacterium]
MSLPERKTDTAPAAVNFDMLLAALPTPAYACSADGRLIQYNERAVQLWGRRPALNDPAERFCGSHAMFSADGTPLAREACWMARALRDGAPYGENEVIIARPDGSQRTVLSYVTPVHDAHGALVAATAVLVDVTQHAEERNATKAALRVSEANFRAFFDSKAIGAVQVNADGVFVGVNDRYCELTGYSREELLKMRPFDLDHPDEREADLEHVRKVIESPSGAYEADKRYVRKDGTIGWVHVAANMLRDENGRPTQSAGLAFDISERMHAEQALQEADRAKDEFLATLAHELRNPLAPLKNAAELLRNPFAEPTWCRDVIERQVNHLSRLIDDLLDVSRITRDKLELRKENVEIGDVIRSAVEASRPMIEASGQTLLVAPLSEPIYVDGDLVRLTQVLTNLLTNAAKFALGEGVIRLSAARDRDQVVVSVADSGIGITKDELSRVFDRFYQSKRRSARFLGGLGIGLSLVRRLVELHGGTVEALSEGPDRGSEFVVRLPVAALAAAEVAGLTHAALEQAPGARKRVLIVDDNADGANSLGSLLAFLGHDTAMEYDGQAALDRAEAFAADVILLDLGMPGLDGFEICRRLRASDLPRPPLIVAMTGWGREEDRART